MQKIYAKNFNIILFLKVYFCMFGFMVLCSLFSEVIRGNLENVSLVLSDIIFSCAIFSFFLCFPLFMMVILMETIKKVKKVSLSEIDFVNSKEYYREILTKYSPAELSYIDDFEIKCSKDIIATLLSLVLKKKISIDNNYIKILDSNTLDLKESEKYILKNIKYGKVEITNLRDLIECVQNETIEDNLIMILNPDEVKWHSFKEFLKDILIYIIIWKLFAWLDISFGDLEVVPIVIFIEFVKILIYLAAQSGMYKRTDVGEDVNRKIEGLKNYIKDFSILDERKQQELVLWDDYLIYSVLFNQNEKIINELSSLVEVEYDDNKIYIE